MRLKAVATISAQNTTKDFKVADVVPDLVGIQTGATNNAAADFELWASYDDGTTWTLLKLIDVADPVGVAIAKLTGASKAAFARCAGATHLRAKRTDANAGNSTLQINVPER